MRTASEYMRLAKHRDKVENSSTAADFTIRAILRSLPKGKRTAPAGPRESTAELIKRLTDERNYYKRVADQGSIVSPDDTARDWASAILREFSIGKWDALVRFLKAERADVAQRAAGVREKKRARNVGQDRELSP